MSISPTLYKYLAAENIQYDEIPHELTMTSSRTAEACHVSGDRLAKAIVLRRDGGYMLAVLPASHRLRMPELKAKLGDDIDMASEHGSVSCSPTAHAAPFQLPARAMGWTSLSTIAFRRSRRFIWKPVTTRRCFI